jgi:hypothetical protein
MTTSGSMLMPAPAPMFTGGDLLLNVVMGQGSVGPDSPALGDPLLVRTGGRPMGLDAIGGPIVVGAGGIGLSQPGIMAPDAGLTAISPAKTGSANT